MAEKVKFESPAEYSLSQPVHIAIYAYNGVGKTTWAGKTPLKTVLLDCGDAGAVTLRKEDPKRLKIIRIKSCLHYIDVVDQLVSKPDFDLIVVDTLTGLQSKAIREVKGRKNFEMNQRKWGGVSSRLIECISETSNFQKDVIYLVQERRKSDDDGDGSDIIMPALVPSVRSALSGMVDWVGYLSVERNDEDKIVRKLDFRITDKLEAKDRATIFPKVLVGASYEAVRNRIATALHGGK